MRNTRKSLRDSLEEAANVIREHGAFFQLLLSVSQRSRTSPIGVSIPNLPPASTQPEEESLISCQLSPYSLQSFW